MKNGRTADGDRLTMITQKLNEAYREFMEEAELIIKEREAMFKKINRESNK